MKRPRHRLTPLAGVLALGLLLCVTTLISAFRHRQPGAKRALAVLLQPVQHLRQAHFQDGILQPGHGFCLTGWYQV